MCYSESVRISPTDTDYLRERIHIPETPCWVWRGYIRHQGYGVWGRKPSETREAHRRSYELLVGPIPPGLEVHHRCFNRSCVNPEHLELLTHGDNLTESRSVGVVNAARTHCVQGHPFDEANTYIRIGPNGQRWRQCRTCRNDAVRKIDQADPNYGRLDRECKNGHPRTPENTIILPTGTKRCRICRQETKRRNN